MRTQDEPTTAQIKKELKKQLGGQWSVRKAKGSMNFGFDVCTDLIQEIDHQRFLDLKDEANSGGVEESVIQELTGMRMILKGNEGGREKVMDIFTALGIEKDGRHRFINIESFEKGFV